MRALLLHRHSSSRSITTSGSQSARRGRSGRRPGGGGAMATPPTAGDAAGAAAAVPAAAALPTQPQQQQPSYAAPLAADARVVIKDASLGVSARVLGERPLHRRYLATFDRLVRFTRSGPAPPPPSSAPAAAALATAAASGDEAQGEEGDEHHHDISYDVIGHPRCEFRFAVVFPYHPPSSSNSRKGGGGAGQEDANANANTSNENGNNNNHKDEGDVTLVREYAHGPHRFVYTLPSGQFERAKHGEGGLLATARAELEEEALLEGGEWHALLPPGHPGIPEVKWCANAFEPFLVVDPVPHPAPAARDGEEEAGGIEAVRVPLREFKRLAASGEMLLPSVATGWMALERLKALGMIS